MVQSLKSQMQSLKSQLLFSMCSLKLLTPGKMPDEEIISLPLEEIKIDNLFDTTNNVRFVSFGDKHGFFRECRVHSEKQAYVAELLNDYYNGKGEHDADDRKSIEKSLSFPQNFKKFWEMGVTNDKNSSVMMYYRSGDASLIGLPESTDADFCERMKSFVQFVWGEIYAYKLNGGIKTGDYQIYNACRCMATERMANLLGLVDIVPHTVFARIVDPEGNTVRFGTLMEPAPGELVKRRSIETRKQMRTPTLQHWLNNLNILDAICYERDHKPSNYHVILDNQNKAVSVCAFDNDAPMTFYVNTSPVFKTYMGCSEIVTKDGYIRRPYMDRSLAEQILSLDMQCVASELSPYLSDIQLIAVRSRIRSIQKAIRNTIQRNSDFLLDASDWNEKTMECELSGEYGRTYLCLFGEDLHLPTQNWITDSEKQGEK